MSPKRRSPAARGRAKKNDDDGDGAEHKKGRLNSPTSLTMSNTFIVKNAD